MSTETLIQAGAFSQIKVYPQRASGLAFGASSAGRQGKSGLDGGFAEVFTRNLKDSSLSQTYGNKADASHEGNGPENTGKTGTKGRGIREGEDAKKSGDAGKGRTAGGDSHGVKDRDAGNGREVGKDQDGGKGIDAGTDEGTGKDGTPKGEDSSLTPEEAMSLQAMMAFPQIPPEQMQITDMAGIRSAGIGTETVLQPGKHGTMDIGTGYWTQALKQDAGQVQELAVGGLSCTEQALVQEAAQKATGMDRQTGPDPAGTLGRTADPGRESFGQILSVQGNEQETAGKENEDTGSRMQDRQDLWKAISPKQDETAGGTPEDVNHVLEELKRSADASGMDLNGRMAFDRLNGNLKPEEPAGDVHTPAPVLEQFKTCLERGVKEGLRELTVHLKPEGLGDMVIHLANAGDKLTVRIGVTNPETEKLVTSQMESLKDMLRPLNAQVQEVYRDSRGTMDFSGFNQQMQEHPGQQAHAGHNRYRISGNEEYGAPDEDLLMEAERMMAESRISRLYAYV